MLCQECKKKSECVELCEKAEKWVNGDHVYQREQIFPHVREIWEGSVNSHLDNFSCLNFYKQPEIASYFAEENVCFPFLSDLQNKCLHLFYFKSLTYKQIASCLSSANQHGVYLKLPSDKVKYQIKKAKQLIRAHFYKSEGGKKNEM